MSQTYTFEELVAWKARSKDPVEQKKIRRLIRNLRATDPSIPSLRRGINADTGIRQPNVDTSSFKPGDKSTWPTTGSCKSCKHPQHVHKRKGCTQCQAQPVQVVAGRTGAQVIPATHVCEQYVPEYDASMWTEQMHADFIDWMATERPLHVKAYVDAAGVPQPGCTASCCQGENWAAYDKLVAIANEEYRLAQKAAKKLKKKLKKDKHG